MKNLTFILLIIIAFISSCDPDSKTDRKLSVSVDSLINANQVENKLIDSTELLNNQIKQQNSQDSIESLSIKGYVVKKLSGNHKYGGKTKVEYKSLWQVISEDIKKSDKEMQTKEEKESRISFDKKEYFGGQIRIDIERGTIGSANTEMFSVIIKDSSETEVFRTKLGSDIPNYSSSSDAWWNISIIGIDKKIKTPFYIYIVDKLEDEPFKFEVNSIK